MGVHVLHIISIGLNYKTAPVEIRERFAFSPESLPVALKALRHTKSILECVILSTCNRMELYVVCDQLHTGRYYTKTFLEQWFRIPKDEFAEHLYFLENEGAVHHLFEVTCGLDSMIMGETQILGQVRDAMAVAQETATTGTLFNRLFRQAITVGKKAQSETKIGQNAVSVSYAAVELGKKIFGEFRGKTALVLGAGEMGELTAKHLHSNGVEKVIVANRTQARAEQLARRFSGEVCSLNDLDKALAQTDVVIASTGSEKPTITKKMVSRLMKGRRHRALFLIDIAVPRDIEPDVGETENVFLYDIDDLEDVVSANMEERQEEAAKVQDLIVAEKQDFSKWLQTLGVVPLITALREKALEIQAEVMLRIERKLPDLTERERRVLSKQTKSIINQMLRDPILQIKELAAEPSRQEALELFERIFALEDYLAEEEEEVKQLTETFRSNRGRISVRS